MRRQPYSTVAVMGIQLLLGALIWGLLAFAAASSAWLFDPQQIRFVMRFFKWQIPVIGGAFAVAIPALQYDRLRDEAAESTDPESDLIPRFLAFPRRVAMMDFFGSLFIFTLAAVEMRLLARTAIEESVKIFLLGPVTGIIFGTLSYLVLGKVMRPLLEEAVARGAFPSLGASIPIASKIFLCCLALAIVTLGLYGPVALGWSQRYVEEQAGLRSEAALAEVVKELAREEPHEAQAWRGLLQSHLAGVDELFVVDRYDRPRGAAAAPGKETGFFKRMENREFLLLRGPGSFASRRDDNLVVSTALLPDGGRVYATSRPDSSVERKLLVESLRISISVFLLALVLAWTAGRAVAGPIVELKSASRRFADDPAGADIPMVISDDETGSLSLAFSEMAHSVKAMRARLAQSERLAGAAESLAAVAHEIRNPLFGITSTAAALETETKEDPRYREYADVITRESQRMARLVEEMLTLKPRTELNPQPGDIESVVRDAADWVSKRFPDRTVHISIHPTSPAVPVTIDAQRMGRVFTNLFENAVLASTDPVRVDVRLTFDDRRAVVDVEDAGPGIPPGELEHIFEPFVSRRAGGTGLGLSICRRIVDEHGGWIEARNRPEGGSVFRIHLPLSSSDVV